MPLHAAYLPNRHVSAKVRVFLDWRGLWRSMLR